MPDGRPEFDGCQRIRKEMLLDNTLLMHSGHKNRTYLLLPPPCVCSKVRFGVGFASLSTLPLAISSTVSLLPSKLGMQISSSRMSTVAKIS